MKKAHPNHHEPTPVCHRRVVELLDAARADAHDQTPDSYARVLREVETVAEILRESTLGHDGDHTEWSLGDGAHDAHVRSNIERSSGTHRVTQSGTRPSITLEEARKVIEELRAEDAVRHELQFAIGGS